MKRLRRKPKTKQLQSENGPFFPSIQKKEMTVEDEAVQTKKEEEEPIQKKGEEEETIQSKEEEQEEPIQKAEKDEEQAVEGNNDQFVLIAENATSSFYKKLEQVLKHFNEEYKWINQKLYVTKKKWSDKGLMLKYTNMARNFK